MPAKFEFKVLPRYKRLPDAATWCAFLVEDNWDDFSYRTTFTLVVFDAEGQQHDPGMVKIAHSNMRADGTRPNVPVKFNELDVQFFSLGQSDSYYETIAKLEEGLRQVLLQGLRDVVASSRRWKQVETYHVTQTSLLRSVSRKSVTGQFKRLLKGGVRCTPYSFSFESAKPSAGVYAVPSLAFKVKPDDRPPTNVHAVIGRNGVGKSRLLHAMATAAISSRNGQGRFTSNEDNNGPLFANVVSVSFSAFDEFVPIEAGETQEAVKYSYIGLSKRERNREAALKSPAILAEEFANSAVACSVGPKALRWRRVLDVLQTDPIFGDNDVSGLADGEKVRVSKTASVAVFRRLSAGHKIVLLTLTRLVEVVEEKTLVLIDEPEAHLHPPLLSAFIRALSNLLVDRNAVSIIATHSPVVLQEVPKTCVWVMRRAGQEIAAKRPEEETFGENVGVLTREVFGLEASHSGYQQILKAVVAEKETYEGAVEELGEALGSEARAVLRAMILKKGSVNQ